MQILFDTQQLQKKSFAENNQKIQATASSFHFKTKKENDYGTLSMVTTKDDKKIITLLKDNKEIATQKANDTLLKFALLSPGNYQIKILYDNNKNGAWDSGNLFEKQMPEVVKFLPEIIAVKANWANKIEVKDEEPKRKLKSSQIANYLLILHIKIKNGANIFKRNFKRILGKISRNRAIFKNLVRHRHSYPLEQPK